MNMEEKDVIPVPLSKSLLGDVDELVESGLFSSRTDVRYGARLVVLKEKRRIHERAEDYAYDAIKESF